MGNDYAWNNWQMPLASGLTPTWNYAPFSFGTSSSNSNTTSDNNYEDLKKNYEKLYSSNNSHASSSTQNKEVAQGTLATETPNSNVLTVTKEQKELQKKREELYKKKEKANTPEAKKKDGSRWLKNFGNTLVNIGKSLVCDEKGDLSYGKIALNVGLTALCFIPGGQIAAGAAWAARGLQVARAAKIGATVAKTVSLAKKGAVAYGAVSGTVGTVQGVNELKNAKTDEEIDAAQQKILGNGIIAGLSVAGGKSMMKKGIKSEFKYYDNMAKASASGTEGSITGSHWKKLDYSVKKDMLQESYTKELAKIQKIEQVKTNSSADILHKQNTIARYEARIEYCKATNAPKSQIKKLQKQLAKEEKELKALQKQQAKVDAIPEDELFARRTVLEEQQRELMNLEQVQLKPASNETISSFQKKIAKIDELEEATKMTSGKHKGKYQVGRGASKRYLTEEELSTSKASAIKERNQMLSSMEEFGNATKVSGGYKFKLGSTEHTVKMTELEHKQIINSLNELKQASRTDFQKLLTLNKSNIIKGFDYDKTSKTYKGKINGRDVSLSKSTYKELKKACQNYNKTLTEIIQAKDQQMRAIAKSYKGKDRRDLQAYEQADKQLSSYLRDVEVASQDLTGTEITRYQNAFGKIDASGKLTFSQKYPTFEQKLYGGTKFVAGLTKLLFMPFNLYKYTKPSQDIAGVAYQDNLSGYGLTENERIDAEIKENEEKIAEIQTHLLDEATNGTKLDKAS